MALNAGDTLNNNHYRIIRQLGRGGFGFVYLAQDTLLGEQVAIKELIPALVGDQDTLKRFLAEARATMRLRHERIVATHNVFTEGGNYYIVMECMAGDSLEARLRERGPLPVDEAVRVAAEVCEGLAYAHERGIVHCDLKPHNILFDANGHAKVADFGIAHISGEVLTRSWRTPQGFVAGTLPYMSPEQADGVRNDPRIDLYALGAVLYRMLTGRTYLDFDQRETPGAHADNVLRIRNAIPVPPSTHNLTVPPKLDAIILKALSKRRVERYYNADELQAALLQDDATTTLPPAPLPPKPRTPASTLSPAQRVPARSGARSVASMPEKASLPSWFWLAASAGAVVVAIVTLAWLTWKFLPFGSLDETPVLPLASPTLTTPASPQPTGTEAGVQPTSEEATPTAEATSTLAPTPLGATDMPTFYPAAVLVMPALEQEINGAVLFQWRWDHPPLTGNDYFDLRIWSEVEEMAGDEPRGVVPPLKETEARVDLEGVQSIQEYRDQTQRYYWAVVVVRKPCPTCKPQIVGRWSEERLFLYAGP